MYVRRKTSKTNDSRKDSHRSRGAGGGTGADACSTANVSITNPGITTTSKLFQPGAKIIVHRAPLLNGLSCPKGLQKKFQRPMLKRRAYNREAENALRRSSLGPKKRMDGMAKLMARAGRGLSFQLATKPKNDESDGDNNSDDEDDEEASEPERPLEPLRVWHSPHQGGEAIGLPATVYVVCLIEIIHVLVLIVLYLLGCFQHEIWLPFRSDCCLLFVVWSDRFY